MGVKPAPPLGFPGRCPATYTEFGRDVHAYRRQAHVSAFLIHDSPREADLGLSIYHQMFEFVHGLEELGQPPLFQYIITTTTRPPDNLTKKPWLRETLRGAPAEERLMRQDL